MRQPRRAVIAVLSCLALGAAVLPSQAAPGASAPAGLRLFTPDRNPVMTIHDAGDGEQWVEFDPAVFLGSRTSRLEIDVRRRDARHRKVATVRVDGKTRKIPAKYLADWNGLRNAFILTWSTPQGATIATTRTDWCPNEGQASRLGPYAATETAFTTSCSYHPFTRSQRWGIDRGWARQVLAYGITVPEQDLGDRVVLEIRLRKALATAFGLTDKERRVRLTVDVEHVDDQEGPGPEPGPVDRLARAADHDHGTPGKPHSTTGGISRDVLPDLVSLPAFGISTHTEDGRDQLDFAATVYNGGSGTLVAEGFRRGSKELMDAYQFFYRGKKQVAARKVGTMGYDNRPSHQHWHFHDFAVYDLVARKTKRVRTSGKEAFCLAPTDAIDLLQRGAVVNPGNGDLATACGGKSSVWVREVLAQGWGDTYTQQRAGQSIDITGLPNGTYWIRVTANPDKRLYERTRKNNVSLRRVVLGGTPGHRTVKVPAYGRIDSEKGYGQDAPVG